MGEREGGKFGCLCRSCRKKGKGESTKSKKKHETPKIFLGGKKNRIEKIGANSKNKKEKKDSHKPNVIQETEEGV